ncbi:MAG: VOC family protein [Candidatus Nanopelagicales bacterium]|jgi:catechol 2,3-dioxygenase-like lactoylglutathione lyase family enzyme|nr:VOC family protein [Candidatus Nanopelagicales bacterium]
MLSTFDGYTTLPTSDLSRARSFYEQTLGFVGDERPEGVVYSAGSAHFLLYQSAYAGTNQATSMGFQVPDDAFDAEVQQLRDRGITFDEFEAEGIAWADGVASIDGGRGVWFHDPDGNILSVATL